MVRQPHRRLAVTGGAIPSPLLLRNDRSEKLEQLGRVLRSAFSVVSSVRAEMVFERQLDYPALILR
jgi:hypothetical protein